MVHRLAYLSTSPAWSRAALIDLLRESRTRNADLGVTGVLLHRPAGFFQLLEGGQAVVEDLFVAIRADPRHEQVTRVWDDDGDQRWFGDWWMAFRDLEDDPVTEPGLTDVLRGPVEPSVFTHEVVLQLWQALRPGPGSGWATPAGMT